VEYPAQVRAAKLRDNYVVNEKTSRRVPARLLLGSFVGVVSFSTLYMLWSRSMPIDVESTFQGAHAKTSVEVIAQRSEENPRQTFRSFLGLGHSRVMTSSIQLDRCSDAARAEMKSLIHEAGDGDVIVIDESSWWAISTSNRVGIASWLSHCTQERGTVRMQGNRTGAILASYDPRDGRRPSLRIALIARIVVVSFVSLDFDFLIANSPDSELSSAGFQDLEWIGSSGAGHVRGVGSSRSRIFALALEQCTLFRGAWPSRSGAPNREWV
jgi:hypothetical protein